MGDYEAVQQNAVGLRRFKFAMQTCILTVLPRFAVEALRKSFSKVKTFSLTFFRGKK